MSSRMSFLKSWLSFWAYKILKGIGDKMKYKGALITGRSKQAQPKYNLLPESRTQSERTAKIDQSNSSGCLSQKNRSEAQRHPWGRCWAEYRRTQKVPVNFSFVCWISYPFKAFYSPIPASIPLNPSEPKHSNISLMKENNEVKEKRLKK